jgi:hypothetical protein
MKKLTREWVRKAEADYRLPVSTAGLLDQNCTIGHRAPAPFERGVAS